MSAAPSTRDGLAKSTFTMASATRRWRPREGGALAAVLHRSRHAAAKRGAQAACAAHATTCVQRGVAWCQLGGSRRTD